LADVLENDEARAKLIDQLRGLAAGQTPTEPGKPPVGQVVAETDGDSFTGRIAAETQQFVDRVTDSGSTAVEALRDLFTGNVDRVINLPDWPSALLHLVLVALATVVAFLAFRA